MLDRSLPRKGGHRHRDPLEGHATDTSRAGFAFTKRKRIAALAEQMPDKALCSLNQYLDGDLLLEACARVRKDAAVGVDGETYEAFRRTLPDRLDELLTRAHTGTYRAPPVRRVYISKGGSSTEQRALGIPTVEDKVLQRAVAMILEPIYEHDFYDGSYGFRPGRSAHDAIDDLRKWLSDKGGGWVLDVDVKKFFDTIDHAHLREFLQRRVRDGVLLRLIGKWLKAGVLEAGAISYPGEGTPQGGVISPLLANIFLHYVLDEWFEQQVKPTLTGTAHFVRWADDFVLAFTNKGDAERVHAALGERFATFGLTIHPEKTRLLPFVQPNRKFSRQDDAPPPPGTFDFLGFTWYWGRTEQGGQAVKTKTAADRIRRTITKIDDWCRTHRHDPINEQCAALSRKLRGHFAYYGRPGNYYSLAAVSRRVERVWQKWLSRRSWKARIGWKRFARFKQRHSLPAPKIKARGDPG